MKNKLMKALLCLTALICGPEVWADGIKLTTDVNNPVYYRISNEFAAAKLDGAKKYLAYNADQGENTVTVTTNEGDAALFYFMKGRYQEIPSSFTAGSNNYAITDAVGVDIYTSTSNGKIMRTATGNWIDPATGNDGRQWYIAPGSATYASTGITYNGYVLAYFKANKTPNVDAIAINQANTNLRYGAQISHEGVSNYAGQIWTLEEVSETPEQIEAAKLKAAKENLQASINKAKEYTIGKGYGQYAYSYAGALPLLTSDDNAPVLYRLLNTRRQAQSKACYITEAGTLSTSTADAVEVYFKGSIADGLASVKMYNTKGQALANTGNSKPAAGDASNLTWDNEGTNVYIQARKSLQGGNYNGVVIAFNNPWHDDLGGDVAGGDVWYVGSSDPVVWAYSGNYDGSIFTLELVDPTQAYIDFDSNALISSAEALIATGTRTELEQKTAEVEDMIAHLSFNMPKAGEFMLLKSHQYNSYVSCSSETKRFPMVSDADASSIFYYDGTHLVNYTSGLVFSNTPVTLTQGDDCNYTAVLKESGSIEFTTSRKKHIGIYSIYTKGGSEKAELLTKAAGNNLDGFSSWLEHEDADIDLVAVNALPVTIKSYGYASFSAPVDVEIPAGVEAYVGKVEGEYLVMTAVEGKIPANTGVILKGTAGETYNMAITKGAAAVAENDLAATYYTKAAPANTYVLGNGTNGAGIYKFNGANVGGFKAYLESASAVKAMVFGGEETAIQNIMNNYENGKVYDLSGRRVEKAQKGIYIQNGKKVVK